MLHVIAFRQSVGGILCFQRTLLLLFLLFQSRDDAVDGGVAVCVIHLCQRLQRVLQMHSFGIGHERIKDFGAFCELCIVLPIFVQHANRLGVTALSISKTLLIPIEISEFQHQHTFLHAIACGLGTALLVCVDSLCRVALGEVDVTHRIVHLIEIIFVLVRSRHAFEPSDHLSRLPRSHHFRLSHTGVEFEFIGRIGADSPLIGLIGFLIRVDQRIDLSKQKIFARFLFAPHLVTDDFLQMWNCLGIVLCVDIEVGQGIIPFLASNTRYGVATGIADDFLSVVEPPTLHVGLGQPGLSTAVDGRLGGIEARHVAERRSGSVEVTFVELRAPHQHPGFPKKGVIFSPLQPLDVALRLFAILVPHGSALDTIALYGFLAFLYSSVVVGFAQFAAVFVANGIERN